ncbi:Putative ribonuclease H protein At1g65750, partial [Linum grandiflorum]
VRRIAWEAHQPPCLTLNTDGAVDQEGRAAAGGALRDFEGCCLLAFSTSLGRCSIMRAELRGITEGLHLVWQQGARQVAVQTDSVAAFQLINSGGMSDDQHASLILQIQELIRRDWDVRINHIYREGNCLADYLAGRGHSLPLGTHNIAVSDPAVASWIAYDRLRSSQPRLVLS